MDATLKNEVMNKEMNVSGPTWKDMIIKEHLELFSELEVKRLVQHVVENALESVPRQSIEVAYLESYEVAKRLKKVLSRQGGTGMVLDMIVAGALLAPSFKELEKFNNYHPIEFEAYIREQELTEGVPDQIVESVCRVVRGYLGPDTPLKEFMPKPGSPEYLVATAYELLKD